MLWPDSLVLSVDAQRLPLRHQLGVRGQIEVISQFDHLGIVSARETLEIDLDVNHKAGIPLLLHSEWGMVENPLGIAEGFVQYHHELLYVGHFFIVLKRA